MNEVLKAIKERRSCRAFKADPVPRELLDQVTEAGTWAPSGMGKQSPVIIEVSDPALRDRLAEANRLIGGWPEGFDPFYGAPTILIVLAQADVPTAIYDGSLVMQNLMLAAHSLGLASIWIHRAKEEFEQDEWKALLTQLGLEGEWIGIGHCALGYAKKEAASAAERRMGRVLVAH